ncbi:MAG TPA: hypothetical protein GX715_00145 [Armatimonadetes bacterium]|nr:hypothetical protein [Armatimonadota bacterium]
MILCSALLLLASMGSARANVTLSNPQVFPKCQEAPTSAMVDGTARSLFTFTITVTVPSTERIQTSPNGLADNVGYVRCAGFPMQKVSSTDSYGSGYYRVSIPGWYFRNDDDSLPTAHQVTFTAYGVPTGTGTATPVNTTLGFSITGRGRQVLIPVDAQGNSDQFKTPNKAGGVTVEPVDPNNYGDGSASATYTFRVKYMDPEGLPPRPFTGRGRFDRLGPNVHNTVNNLELDQYNVPRRTDDPWRFVTPTDLTLPEGVAPQTYRSGVHIVFDDDGDGRVLVNPGAPGGPIDWFRNYAASDPPALTRNMDAPRMMVIDTDLQPQFLNADPTAADWRNGVIFKYTCRGTDHSVAVGIPRFFEFGSAVLQFALSPFSDNPGQKYLNAGRTGRQELLSGQQVYDPRTRSFVSLPAGLRKYSFFASNDIQFATLPSYGSLGPGRSWGTVVYNDGTGWSYAAGVDPYVYNQRWFQQPYYNLPNTDPASPPRQVFHPPFEIRVDPQITVDQEQLRGDTNQGLIGIPAAVAALRDDGNGGKKRVALFCGDLNRARPSRLCSTDEIQWRFYYTQSEGLPPTVCEMHLFRQDENGSFVPVPLSPFACTTLASGANGMDPLYKDFSDSTLSSAFFAQYGVKFPGLAADALEPGVYRYFFRVSDGRRMAEWPGDTAGGTSLTTSAQVSHIANTLRINHPPELSQHRAVPTVDPKTGAVSWTIEVVYRDLDGDPPSTPHLVFPDPSEPDNAAKSLVLVMQRDPSTSDFTQGVRYRLQSATDPTVGAFQGRREYFFEFTDNWKNAQNPEPGETATLLDVDPNNPTGPGKPFFLNSKPFLLDVKVENATDPGKGAKGSLSDNFKFSVRYGDNERDTPAGDLLELVIDGQDVHQMVRDPAQPNPDYAAGVVYSITLNGRTIGAGPHRFRIVAKDPLTNEEVQVQGTGPSIYVPTLSEASVQRTDGTTEGSPSAGKPGTGFRYSVRYRHEGDKPGDRVFVHILNPASGGQATVLDTVELKPEDPNPAPGTVAGQGVVWRNETPYTFNAPGTYSYYFEASDGDSVRQVYQDDANKVPFSGPVVGMPVLTPQAVTPVRGVVAQTYEFSVLYAHAGSIPPNSVYLRVFDPKGALVELPNQGLMAPPAGAAEASLANPGWLHTVKVKLSEPGVYRYAFTATDGATEVDTAVLDGPTVMAIDQPVLTGESVSSAPGQAGQVIYRVTYRQSQNLMPAIYVIVPNAAGTLDAYPMAQENPADTDLTDGAVFARMLPSPTGSGPFSYHFLVRVEGLAEIRYPEQGGAHGPNVVPTLMVDTAVGGALPRLSPTSGHTGTPFTFSVRCRDADAPENWMETGLPRVCVIVGNQKLPMAYVEGDVREASGALYQTTTKLPAGSLMHSFTAEDGFDTATLADENGRPFAGPMVLPETRLNLTITPEQLTLDGLTPIRVSGALDPVIPSTDVKVTYAWMGADGQPVEMHVNTVTATSEGRFTDAFVPVRSGRWQVTAEFASDAERGIGGGYEQLVADVSPGQITIPAGLSMMGVPVTPDGGKISDLFVGSDFQLARWNAALGAYDFGPVGSMPTPKPGDGFWLSTKGGIVASTVGETVPHNASVSVPLQKGWNQVANPFLLPISWSSVAFQDEQGTVMSLSEAAMAPPADRKIFDHAWIYDGSEYALVHASVPGARRDVLPWQGLWVKSNVAGRLVFAPPLARSAHLPQEPVARRERGRTGEWTLQLVAGNGAQSDSYNFAGVTGEGRAQALTGLESPPRALGQQIDLYFTGQAGTGRYATDFRSSSTPLPLAFDFVVETDARNRAVSVRCPNLAELPKELDVILEDVDAAGKRVYLRTASGYSFNPGETGTRRLRLIVQPRTEGALRIDGITFGSTRGGRSISFSVSRASMATVEILAPNGRRLKTVADRRAVEQGMNTVTWDLSRADGSRLPRGLYVVQITATTPEGQTARAVKPIAVVTW